MTESTPAELPQDAPEPRNLEEIVTAGDAEKANEYLESLPLSESFRVLTEMGENEQKQLLTLLPGADAAALIEQLPETHAAHLIAQLPAGEAAAIIDAMHSDEQADVIGRLDPAAAEAILVEMDPAEASDVRRRVEYPRDTAGGLMITEYLYYRDDLDVDDVLNDLRDHATRYAAYDVQYAYVVSKEDRLVGVLRLRDLLLSSRQTAVASVMIRQPLWVYVQSPLVELGHFFDRHPLFGAPVTDEEGRLVGVVRRADVEEAAEENANQTLLKLMGILGGEELRSVPLRTRCVRRLSWLTVNILLNIIAASVIAINQDTLAAVIALGVVMPIISDMSGCAGTQAIAVTMREL
ncbi:MAG: CBS domain-containing protein, partial [Planctomycetaceae bacterium]